MQLKIEVLKMLENNRDRDVSGQMIADRFGVSRNAVWKVVNSLKEDGYRILAGQNRGYRLAEDNDMLSAVAIGNAITRRMKGLSIYVHKELDSTNNEAKRLIAEGKTGPALILAEGQTDGRGRQGKTFYSPSGTGIYMTFSFPTRLPLTAAVAVTTATAVAVFRAVRDTTGIETEIKWVNDLYLGGRKICGILTESIADFESGEVQNLIVGIGLNFRTADFPRELADIAASLHPMGVDRNHLIARIVDCLVEVLSELGSGAHLDTYRRHSMVLGKKIEYLRDGERTVARAIDIDEDGWLIVEHENGRRDLLNSGEITLRTTE